MAACRSWITSPVAKSCVYGYYVLLLLRVFFLSHTVLPKEHSPGVIFFSPHLPHVMLYFSSIPCLLSCLPPCHICMLCMYGQVDG